MATHCLCHPVWQLIACATHSGLSLLVPLIQIDPAFEAFTIQQQVRAFWHFTSFTPVPSPNNDIVRETHGPRAFTLSDVAGSEMTTNGREFSFPARESCHRAATGLFVHSYTFKPNFHLQRKVDWLVG
jgi:hypothetical protein